MIKNNWQKAEKILKKDGLPRRKAGVVVLPTDTLYGLVGSALSKNVVERIYKIKGRGENKPFIVLVNSYKQIENFGINLPLPSQPDGEAGGSGQWPRGSILKPKVSVILQCKNQKFKYIHRGLESIAFRMISPRNKNLFNLINKVGPIVAPSANPEGQKPAETIIEARKYFGDKIDLYIDGGKRKSLPSTLVRIVNEKIEILRQGTVKIK